MVTHNQPEVAVHSIDHFSLIVPDLGVARDFYSEFGLDVSEEDGRLSLKTRGGDHLWGYIYEGKRKKTNYICFGVFEQDIEALKNKVTGTGVTLMDPPAQCPVQNAFWFCDPDGNTVGVRVAEKVTPNTKAHHVYESAPEGQCGALNRRNAPKVRPSRLSHILIFVSDVAQSIEFYHQTLGLRLSDVAEDAVAFMHAPYGADHHTLAFAKSDGIGIHHTSWDVSSIDEVGLGAMQMKNAGWLEGWGVGRHVLGSNYFYYVRDPWKSYCEYSFDIDYIPSGSDWKAGHHQGEDSLYLWGEDVPAEFVKSYEFREE